MEKRSLVMFSVSIILILSLSLVSAGWFNDFWNKITGQVAIVEDSNNPVDGTTQCEEGYTCLDSNNLGKRVFVDGASYVVSLISASDTTATIKVNSETKEVDEGATKKIGGLNVYVKSADENNGFLKVVLGLSLETTVQTCTDSDGGKNYYKLGTVIAKGIGGINSTGDDSCMDGTNPLNSSLSETGPTLIEQYCEIDNSPQFEYYNCPNGCLDGACVRETVYKNISLNSSNKITTVVFNNYTYQVELISASDTSATIKVTNGGASQTKEVRELETKEIQGLNVAVTSADETNLFLSATLRLSFVSGISGTVECEAGYTCLDSNNTKTMVTFNNFSYEVELLSASDTAATIEVTTTGGQGVTKEINGGATKEVNGLSVYVKEADENNGYLSVVFRISLATVKETGNKISFDLNVGDNITLGNRILMLYDVYNQTTGTSAITNDRVKFKDIMTGEIYETTFSTEGSGVIDVDGKRYIITFMGTGESAWVTIKKYTTAVPPVCDSGCSLNGKCYPYNNRKGENYCAVGGTWSPQLESGEACDNNFECGTNICVSNQCIEGNIIQKILAWFR
jgi:hypothetical protein